MKTSTLAVIIVFAALTVVLNPALTGLGVPAPYAPYLVYQIWEIPMVAVLLLYGPKYGVPIAVLNAFVLLAIYMGPGGLAVAPFYNLAAFLSMALGLYIPYLISAHRRNKAKPAKDTTPPGTILIAVSTLLGIVFRVAVMSIVNYIVLRFDPPIGYSLPEPIILGSLPFIGLFNATLALYTIPTGFIIANIVKTRLRLNNGT